MRSKFGSYNDLTIDLTALNRVKTPHGHTTLPVYRVPPSPNGTDAVAALTQKESQPGIRPYPGRVVRLPHPKGAAVEGITTGTVSFTANPSCRYSPLLQEFSNHSYYNE